MRFFILLMASSVLLVGCQSNPLRSEPHTLQATDVKRLFSGHTVESYNLNTKFTSFTYYDPGGRLVQERFWSRRKGNWTVTKDGQICLGFGDLEPRCRHIVREGDRYYKVRPDSSGRPVRIVRYRYFSPGNALGRR